ALMAYLARCAPERIPITLIEGAVKDEVERMEALAALAEVSLIKHDPFEDGTLAVTVHRLVQAVARARSVALGLAANPVEQLVGRLVAIYPQGNYSNPRTWPLCNQLTPHLLALRETASDEVLKMGQWANLLNRAGHYLIDRASYVEAGALIDEALAVSERVLGSEHPDTVTSLNNFANLLHERGDLTRARSL